MTPIRFPSYNGATPTEGQILAYNAATGLWEPKTIAGVGTIPASEVSNTPAGSVSATNVQAAINELDAEKQAAGNYVSEGDLRLADARPPIAHKASHATGGADALAPSDIGALPSSHATEPDPHPDYQKQAETDARYFSGVQDHGTLEAFRAILNFTGAGVSVIDDGAGGRVNVDIPGGGTGSSVQVQDEDATAFAARPTIRFTGDGVTATEDALNNRVNVAVPGGTGSATNASDTQKGVSRLSAAPADPADPLAVGTNDPRVPTTGENDALLGTSGAPSGTNRYVTNDDPRNTDARTPTDGSVTNAKVGSGAAIEEAKLALASDAAANVASRRTLGTGASQAAAGNHSHANATQSAAGFQSAADKTKLDGLSTSDPIPLCTSTEYWGYSDPAGGKWLMENGRAVSRTTYPDFFNAITFAEPVSTTNGSTTISDILSANTANIPVGCAVEGVGIPLGATVVSVSSTSVVISAAATATGTPTARFGPHGLGDNSTTFNIPDPRSRAMVAAGQGSGLTLRKIGDKLGAETVTLADANLPPYVRDVSWAEFSNASTGGSAPRYTNLAKDRSTSAASGHENVPPSIGVNRIVKVLP